MWKTYIFMTLMITNQNGQPFKQQTKHNIPQKPSPHKHEVQCLNKSLSQPFARYKVPEILVWTKQNKQTKTKRLSEDQEECGSTN